MPIQNTRPLAVTLIALFQFCRAALILLVMLGIWLNPNAHLSSRLDVQVLIYIASRHNLPPSILIPIVMPVIAVCIAVDGWGLWRLQKWARNILMATSGITVLLWLRAFLVLEWAEGQTILKDELARQSVYAVVLLDALIFCCLAFYPDVAQAFGKED